MLHLATLAPSTLGLLRRIQSQAAFADTRLVGGAALALHFGHRTSLDLDLFGSWKPLPPLELALSNCAARVMKTGGEDALQFFTVDDVKIDCVAYPYKWLRPAVVSDGIRLADIPDIAAMKLAAATNRGTRKDFVDVYFLLRKYSQVAVDGQFRHLRDKEKCAQTERLFGRIASRKVYYRGPDFVHPSGVVYCNVEDYLKSFGHRE